LSQPSATEAAAPDIELRGVARAIDGRRIVDGITLSVRRGEFFSLLGPSGCGKTTLLRLLSGFDEPDEGEILLGGVDMRGVPPHRRDLNMVFQSYALFPHLSVRENVAFGLKMQRARDVDERVEDALAAVRLSGYEARSPGTLSGGEQQRVALARATVTSPRVLLLDEPLGALDLKLRRGLQVELRGLQRRLGMTFVYVTHDQEEALGMSDRVAVMNRGRIVQIGPPREIYEHPADRFVAEFVGVGNFFDGESDGGATLRTPDGLALPAPRGARGRATLLVRPEKIAIGKQDGGAITGIVEEIQYHGPSFTILVRAGERRIVVEDTNDEDLAIVRPGETVHLRWRAEDARLLPCAAS
jgi:spermidine/putrescine transport system ATP-binding protein